MAEFFNGINWKSIEAVNKKLVDILNMPEELLKLYTSKPYLTEDEQASLEKAAEAYRSEKYETAITHYKKCSVSISMKNNVNINNNNEKSQLDIIVQYLLSKCMLKSEKFADLSEAQNILLQLGETIAQRFPMIYGALGEFYIKMFCFEDAERTINSGLAILNDENTNLSHCYIPITNEIIVESTNHGLSIQLLKLKNLCTGWHRPDAVCFMTNCRSNSPYHLSGRNIYFNSPAFNGMVIIICNNVNSCNIPFHAACWKAQKKILSFGQKISDKDFLHWECFTPNCGCGSVPSIIKRIEFRNVDKTIKHIELADKNHNLRYTPSKGATRKQKIKHIDGKSSVKPKPPAAKKLIPNVTKEDKKISNESDEVHSRLMKLIHLRENNFNIDKNKDWRPDIQYYGNLEFSTNYDKVPPQPDCSNDNRNVAGLKSFLYSYFYTFISKNGPVKTNILQKKWEEVADLKGDCDTILYNSGCGNIIEFLLDSFKFVVIGDYMCTPESMPETYALVKNNTCTALRYLMDSNNDFHLEDEDEDLEKSIIPNANEFETILIDDSRELMNSDVASTVDPESYDENNHLLTNDYAEKSFSEPHILMKEEKLPYTTEIIECENDIMTNDDITHSELPSSSIMINNNKNLDDIVTENIDTSTEIISSLMKQTEELCNKLKVKDTQLTDMKMAMLRTDLDSQYITIRASINNRLTDCLKEYSIVGKVQTALMRITGTQLPLDQQEWTQPIEQLEKMCNNLHETYEQVSTDINSKEYCKNISGVQLQIPNFPTLPNHDIPELLQMAFAMCHNHFQRTQMPPPIIPNSYLQSFPPNPPVYIPQYRNYPIHQNYVVPQPPLIPPLMPQLPLITNNLQPPSGAMPKPSSLNVKAEQTQSEKSSNFSKKKMTESQIAKTQTDIKQKDETLAAVDSRKLNEAIERNKLPKNPMPSIDVLMNLLRSRNRGVLEYDLLWTVNEVRKTHNNSLTGLPLSVIINEIEKRLIHREKLQLADYSTNLYTDVSRASPRQQQRKTSVSSTSSYVSTNSVSRESTTKKNPWNTVKDITSLPNVDYDHNECVICFEVLQMNEKTSKQIYKLQCMHTFHKKCIENWFKENRSCPTCRVYSTMDSDFPPL